MNKRFSNILIALIPALAASLANGQIKTTPKEQIEYESAQTNRFTKQLAESGLTLDQITASFIDAYSGDANWVATTDELRKFENDSGKKNTFYAVIRGTKIIEEDGSPFATNHPFDFMLLSRDAYVLGTPDARLVFDNREATEKRIKEITSAQEDKKARNLEHISLGKGLGYIEVKKADVADPYQEPFTVSAFYESSPTGFIKREIHIFQHRPKIATLQATPQVLIAKDVPKREGMIYFRTEYKGQELEVGIPAGNVLEKLVTDGSAFYALYEPTPNNSLNLTGDRKLFIGDEQGTLEAEVQRFDLMRDGGSIHINYKFKGEAGYLSLPAEHLRDEERSFNKLGGKEKELTYLRIRRQ